MKQEIMCGTCGRSGGDHAVFAMDHPFYAAPVVPDTAAPHPFLCACQECKDARLNPPSMPTITIDPLAAYPSEKARQLVSLDDVRKLAQHFGSFLNSGRPMTSSRKARWVAARQALDDALVSVFSYLAAVEKERDEALRVRDDAKAEREAFRMQFNQTSDLLAAANERIEAMQNVIDAARMEHHASGKRIHGSGWCRICDALDSLAENPQ